MEINKAFEIIASRVEAVLLQKGFEKHSVPDTNNEKTVLYTGSVAYSIVYYYDKKRVVLRSCAMDGDEPDNAWKTVETIIGPKQIAVQKRKKARDENGDIINDPLFFSNRMIAYFPDLKDDIAYEKAHYTSFRGITFADEKILPRFREYVKTSNKRDIEKLSKSMGELYDAGDLDVKGIITYILLNSIESDEKFEEFIAGFTPELKKIARASRDLRGKKIKPEKPKKPKKYMTDTLNDISSGKR